MCPSPFIPGKGVPYAPPSVDLSVYILDSSILVLSSTFVNIGVNMVVPFGSIYFVFFFSFWAYLVLFVFSLVFYLRSLPMRL